MSDLPNRLRFGTALLNQAALIELCEQAADEIDRLRAMLMWIAKHPDATELIKQYAAGKLGNHERS